MQSDPAKLREFAARYTDAWCSQDAASVAGFYSSNGSLTINNGTPAVGRKEIAEVAQSFMTAFPDLDVVMDDLVIRVDGASYHWTLIGTNTGRERRGIEFRLVASRFGRLDRMNSSLPRGVTLTPPITAAS